MTETILNMSEDSIDTESVFYEKEWAIHVMEGFETQLGQLYIPKGNNSQTISLWDKLQEIKKSLDSTP